MRKPRILRRRTICRNAFVTVEEVRTDFGNHRKTYYVSDYGRRVGILVRKGECILLVSQFRFLIGRPSWEIPGGRVESGESTARAARRECREETGVQVGPLRRLLEFMPGTDVLANRTTVYVGTATGQLPRASDREIRSRAWVPIARCLKWIRTGKLVDGLTVTAVLGLVVSLGSETSKRLRF